jgi:hypothetical protein
VRFPFTNILKQNLFKENRRTIVGEINLKRNEKYEGYIKFFIKIYNFAGSEGMVENIEKYVCSNCKQEIRCNFETHVLYCERNIVLCSICNEPIHKLVC